MKKKYLFVSVFLLIIGVKTANADCFSDYASADYAAKSAKYNSLSSIVWDSMVYSFFNWASSWGSWATAGSATYSASQIPNMYASVSAIDSQYWNSINGAVGALNRCLGN